MEEKNKLDVATLLSMLVVQLTGAQLCDLMMYVLGLCGDTANHKSGKRTLAYGVQALAEALGCSPSKLYSLMNTARPEDGSVENGGILREAIVSRIGRRIVFDIERARELANEHTIKNKKTQV